MPRAKRTNGPGSAFTSADLAELQAALGGTLPKVAVTTFPHAEWTALALACFAKGYTVVLSPQLDGRAVRISVPVGTGRLALTAGNDQELLEAIRSLTLGVAKLPAKD